MGTTASLQNDESSRRRDGKAVTAESVRRRLHNEYYGDDGALQQSGDQPSGMGMADVPTVLKAKSAFLKGINKDSHIVNRRGDDSNIVKKQV